MEQEFLVNQESLMNNIPPSTVESNLKPGHRLRLAREARGWNQQKVSRLLHLSVPHVKSLEEDDYSYVPAPVYVRGHIALYARLLELPLAEILQGFALPSERALQQQKNIEDLLPNNATLKHFWFGDKKLLWLGAGVLTIAILMVLVWLADQRGEKQPARHTIVVAPGDAENVSQVNDNAAVIPVAPAPENAAAANNNAASTATATENHSATNATQNHKAKQSNHQSNESENE
jgi:cytoskeleton protein RodZ